MNTPIICHDYFGRTYSFNEADYIDRESVYLVLLDNNRILMVEDAVSGRWEFPGGGVEQIEDTFTALEREVLEETGLIIIPEQSQFLVEFTEFFYDLSSRQPWKSLRKFFRATKYQGSLLERGNSDDMSAKLPL